MKLFDKAKKEQQKQTRVLFELSPYLTMGWQLVITILLGVFGGIWLDDIYETEPLWTIVLTFAGTAMGFYTLIRSIMMLEKKKNKKTTKDQ